MGKVQIQAQPLNGLITSIVLHTDDAVYRLDYYHYHI